MNATALSIVKTGFSPSNQLDLNVMRSGNKQERDYFLLG